MMDDFRAIFDLSMVYSHEPFHVHVIGFRKVFDYLINVPGGTDNYFIYCVHDAVEMRTTAGIIEVPPHTMIIYPPGAPLYMGRRDSPWCHSWLRCSGSAVAGILERSGVPCNQAICFDSSELNDKFLTEIYREQAHPGGADALCSEYWFRLWMRNMGRHWRQPEEITVPEPFRRAREYLSAHYLEPIQLEALARFCGISRSYLCKGFRRYFQSAPLDYAITLKLQHAAEMLSNREMNISEVALRCGFEDVFYFSRLFKRHLGISPLRYRKQFTGYDHA